MTRLPAKCIASFVTRLRSRESRGSAGVSFHTARYAIYTNDRSAIVDRTVKQPLGCWMWMRRPTSYTIKSSHNVCPHVYLRDNGTYDGLWRDRAFKNGHEFSCYQRDVWLWSSTDLFRMKPPPKHLFYWLKQWRNRQKLHCSLWLKSLYLYSFRLRVHGQCKLRCVDVKHGRYDCLSLLQKGNHN